MGKASDLGLEVEGLIFCFNCFTIHLSMEGIWFLQNLTKWRWLQMKKHKIGNMLIQGQIGFPTQRPNCKVTKHILLWHGVSNGTSLLTHTTIILLFWLIDKVNSISEFILCRMMHYVESGLTFVGVCQGEQAETVGNILLCRPSFAHDAWLTCIEHACWVCF